MKKLYRNLWKKEEKEEDKHEREEFEIHKPAHKAHQVSISDLYNPSKQIQETIQPWEYGVNSLKDVNLALPSQEEEKEEENETPTS